MSKNNQLRPTSKIKNIAIELHNYSFFHGPSEISKLDDRFIGRRKIIEKLQTILTRSETKSGVYLVTGYRGMGKSSFVSKAIEEISTVHKPVSIMERFFRSLFFLFLIWIGILVFAQIDVQRTNLIFGIISLFSFGTAFLIHTVNLKGKFSLEIIPRNFKNSFFLRVNEDIMLLSLITFTSVVVKYLFFPSKTAALNLFEIMLLLLILFFLTHIGFKFYWDQGFSIKKLLNGIKKYFSYLHRITVKINLGFEDLKEIDVLKLVASHLQTQYENILTLSRRNILTRFLLFVAVVLITFSLFDKESISSYHKTLNDKFMLWHLFPSQISSYQLTGEKLDTIKINHAPYIGYDTTSTNVRKFKFLFSLNGTSEKFQNYISKFDTSIKTKLIKNSNSLVSRIESNIGPITRYMDYVVFNIYYLTICHIPFLRWYTNSINLNYYAIVYFLIILLIFKNIYRLSLSKVLTHKEVYKKIVLLNEQIDSQVTLEKSGELKFSRKESYFNLKRNKSKSFPIADVREIEKKLIQIFEDMDSVPRHTIRPEFIFIFDELDKVEPKDVFDYFENSNIYLENSSQDKSRNVDASRIRQQTILKILANLKHFLTTSKSKFIFIAGRELYDASLADVSDRNFFLGSIFNDVIYVDSFLKESSKDQSSDVSGLTEKYVCQYLFPEQYLRKLKKASPKNQNAFSFSLSQYLKYLNSEFFQKKFGRHLTSDEKQKILNELLNFITYLTYRSCGTPKKLTLSFEKNVAEYNKEFNNNDFLTITCNTQNKNNFFLVFRYYDQYTFGMISYMTNPFLYSINRSIKDYNDKLLVSLSFILDHIYKFHKVGFSWEDIETSPEIVDIHKAPQVKELFSTILRFLSYTQIEVINSGLFNFKFNKRISDEINYLCKVNDKESAAFNFTLDESLVIKKHYKTKINDLLQQFDGYKNNENQVFIKSLSHLHMIIGDLSFYDEEYDNAIIEYLEALQLYGKMSFEDLDFESMIIYIKNSLKLGLAYEKKKSFDFALLTYGKITARILKLKEKDLNEIIPQSSQNRVIDNYSLDSIRTRDWSDNLDREFFRITIYEKLRILYLPLIAKFQMIDKSGINGLSQADLEIILKEYSVINKKLLNQHNAVNNIEFLDKIGDLLYFKNGKDLVDGSSLQTMNCCSCPSSECVKNIDKDSMLKMGYVLPCSACALYNYSLNEFIKTYIIYDQSNSNNSRLSKVFQYLDRSALNSKEETLLRAVANLLSDLGDVYLSCASRNAKISHLFLEKLIMVFRLKNSSISRDNKFLFLDKFFEFPNSKLEESLIYIYLSGAYYRKSMDYKEYGFQLLKILYILFEYYNESSSEKDFLKSNIEEIRDGLVKRAIRAFYRAYENAHQIELSEYEAMLEDGRTNENPNLNTISIVWEIQEIILLYNYLRILAGDVELKYEEISNRSIRPIYSMYNRSLELEFFEFKNRMIYENLDNNLDSIMDKRKTLICDSVFCLFHIIKICKISGVSFDINHLYLAKTYKKLSYWCNILNNDEIINKSNKIDIITALGPNIANDLTTLYNFEQALRHFRLAIDAQNNGVAYKELIEEMVFLNDDYNDNFYHFSSALERYSMKASEIFNTIDNLRDSIDNEMNAGEYNVDNYSVN